MEKMGIVMDADKIVNSFSDRSIKLISFDIFDTLLFRMCREPGDIFEKMYEKNPELFPDGICAESWKTIRRETELLVKKERYAKDGIYEVTIDDIYARLPLYFTHRTELKKLEIDTEVANCFVNDVVYNALIKLYESGKKIVLASDMYLPQTVIRDMLISSGIDMQYINGLYVSCESDTSKRYKGLYTRILEDYGLKPQEMGHVGDNSESDIASPSQMGINICHYTLISEAKIRYPYLKLEQLAYEFCEKDSYPIRLLTAAGRDDFWYETGAMVMGPLLSYFALWIVQTAKRNHIKFIRPMMREGDFLAQMIQNAADYLKADVDIRPLYVSRFALETALYDDISETQIKYLFSTHGMKLRDVFEVLKIEDQAEEFKDFFDIGVVHLKKIPYDDSSLYDKIYLWLIQKDTIALIQERNADSSQWVMKYFEEMSLLENSVMTVDIFWKGSMQKAMDDLLSKKGADNKLKHVVCIVKPFIVDNLYPDTAVTGYIGNYGKDSKITLYMFARIYELSLLSDKGTTTGYEMIDGNVYPVTEQIEYPGWQIEAMKSLQQGVLDFQRNLLPHVSDMTVEQLEKKAKECIAITERLMCFPTCKEVKYMKNLVYDQNFGANSFAKLLDDQIIEEYCSMSEREYEQSFHDYGIIWEPALYSIREPLYYYHLLFKIDRRYALASMSLIIADAVLKAKKEKKKITLVGAGEYLKPVLNMISAMGALDEISAIVDNSEAKQGALYYGIKVSKVSSIKQNNIFLCTARNKAAYDSLETQVKSVLNSEIQFYGYGQNMYRKQGAQDGTAVRL